MSAQSSRSATENTLLLPTRTIHPSKSVHKNLGENVPLYSRPRQRQGWDDQQILPHVNWGDLFFDLFYVAGAFNLAVILKESLSWEGFLYFLSCYFPIMAQWNEKLIYDARFAPEDNLYHRLLECVHLLLLGTAIQHIRPVELMQNTKSNSTTLIFSLCLVLMNVLGIKRNQDVHTNVMGGEEAKHHATSDIRRRFCALIPFLISTLLAGRDCFHLIYLGGGGDNARVEGYGGGEGGQEMEEASNKNNIPILFCLVGYISEHIYVLVDVFVVIPNSGRDFREIRVPLNVNFTLHRIGEWVMLMLGESVLSLLIVEESSGRRYYVTFYSFMVSVIMLQYLYFRTQPFDADDHAMRRNQSGAFIFYHSIVFYSASLIVIGCSFKTILHHYIDEQEANLSSSSSSSVMAGSDGEDEDTLINDDKARRIAHMFSWSMAASFFFLDAMILSHRGFKANRDRLILNGSIHWAATLIVLFDCSLFIVTATLSLWIRDFEILCLAGCGIVVCQIIMRTRGLKYFPVSKSASDNDFDTTEVGDIRRSVSLG